VVTDGRQAVDFCEGSGDLDLILMDGEMPELDGWQAAQIIRSKNLRRKNGLPVTIVVMTRSCPDTHEVKAAQHGMDGFHGKPIDPEQLKKILLSVAKESQ
jgi:CheY-like chemotaxis protein